MSAIDNARAALAERIASTLASMPAKTAQRRARDLDIIVPLWALDEVLAEQERLTAPPTAATPENFRTVYEETER